MSFLPFLLIFVCAAVLEGAWVLSIGFVNRNRVWAIAANAMFMQGISYLSTIIVVHDSWTTVVGIAGAGVGAVVGMKLARKTSVIPQADVL